VKRKVSSVGNLPLLVACNLQLASLQLSDNAFSDNMLSFKKPLKPIDGQGVYLT